MEANQGWRYYVVSGPHKEGERQVFRIEQELPTWIDAIGVMASSGRKLWAATDWQQDRGYFHLVKVGAGSLETRTILAADLQGIPVQLPLFDWPKGQ